MSNNGEKVHLAPPDRVVSCSASILRQAAAVSSSLIGPIRYVSERGLIYLTAVKQSECRLQTVTPTSPFFYF